MKSVTDTPHSQKGNDLKKQANPASFTKTYNPSSLAPHFDEKESTMIASGRLCSSFFLKSPCSIIVSFEEKRKNPLCRVAGSI